MGRYVVDAVTLLHLADHDVRVDPSHQLVAPNSVRSAVLELMLQEVRRGERTDEAALQVHERSTELKIRLLGDRVSRGRAWRIARDHEWATLSTAEYLAITQLQADAFVTVDLAMAARAARVVTVVPLKALLLSRPALK